MQVLKSIAELDEKIAECDRAAAVSDHAMREVLGSFRMDMPHEMPREPMSAEYAQFQLDFYRQLAGKDYHLANEETVFDVNLAVSRPFPYCTGGTSLTADQFTAIGALLRRLQLSPGARIVEFGPGWGNTTLALAQLGFKVTAIDIEARFCELVRRRVELHGLHVEAVNGDFSTIEETTEPYDAAIFFECFHHASDHRRLLRALHAAIAPEGRILFGGEPISQDFPIPWGLRMDGQALWSIRKHGWFELGFSEDYFIEVLAQEHWVATKFPSGDSPFADVWEARKCRREAQQFAATDPRIVVPSEKRDSSGIHLRNLEDQWGFYGPYVTLAEGAWLARVFLGSAVACKGQGTLDVCTAQGAQVIAQQTIDLGSLGSSSPSIDIPFHLARPTTRVEVRWHCKSVQSLDIERIELVPTG